MFTLVGLTPENTDRKKRTVYKNSKQGHIVVSYKVKKNTDLSQGNMSIRYKTDR